MYLQSPTSRAADGLRIFQALLLVDARRLAHVVVLDDEVALRVQVQEQLLDVVQGRLLVHLLLFGGLDLRVEVGLRGLLRRDRLNLRWNSGIWSR